MIRSSMQRGGPIRPSGQIPFDQTQVNATVENFENRAGWTGAGPVQPLFDTVGLPWLGTNPDQRRQIVAQLLANVGVFNTNNDYQNAVAQEINSRLMQIRMPTGPTLHLTCEQWRGMSDDAKRAAIAAYFSNPNISYLYIRPADYDYVIGGNDGTGGINGTCPASDGTPTSDSTAPTIVRVTLSAQAAFPRDLAATFGDIPMRKTGQNTFETDDIPTATSATFHSQLVITGTGLTPPSQALIVSALPHVTTDVAVLLTMPSFGFAGGQFTPRSPTSDPTIHTAPPTCPPTPLASSFASAGDRKAWTDRYPACPPPGPWVDPCAPPAFSNEPDRQTWIHANPTCPTPPAASCPTPPETWADRRARRAWVEAHSACPPPPAWVDPCQTPPYFANEPDRQAWIHANPTCPTPPAANCPTAPLTWASKRERRAWVEAHSACPPPPAWVDPCPTPPTFANEADRQAWIRLHPVPCPIPPSLPVTCPPSPTSWSTEADRQTWIAAHAGCPVTPYCPAAPATFYSEADRQSWIDAHAGCTAPGPYCPPAPSSWALESDRTAWIAAHAGCPVTPYCPALPASFATAEDRQAWIDAHAGCSAPVWSAPAIVVAPAPKKSSFWKWVGLAVVVGGGYVYKKNKEAK